MGHKPATLGHKSATKALQPLWATSLPLRHSSHSQPRVLSANPKPCLQESLSHFTVTCGFWLTTNRNCKYKVVFRLPRTVWGYTCLTRLTFHTPTLELPGTQFTKTTTKHTRLAYLIKCDSLNNMLVSLLQKLTLTHTNFHLVVHHLSIFDATPLMPSSLSCLHYIWLLSIPANKFVYC